MPSIDVGGLQSGRPGRLLAVEDAGDRSQDALVKVD